LCCRSWERGILAASRLGAHGNLLQITDGQPKSIVYDHAWGRTSDTIAGVTSGNSAGVYTIKRHFTPTGTIDWIARDNAGGEFTSHRTVLEHADPLERETLRTPPAGYPTATSYADEADEIDAANPDGTGPYIETSRGTAWTRSYLDGYGRTRRTVVNPPTASAPPTMTTTRYDALGRKVFESLPFTDTEVGASYTYDALGRVKTKTTPAGKTTTYNYGRSTEGATVTITEPFALGGTRTTGRRG
jgi:hypothetical protein